MIKSLENLNKNFLKINERLDELEKGQREMNKLGNILLQIRDYINSQNSLLRQFLEKDDKVVIKEIIKEKMIEDSKKGDSRKSLDLGTFSPTLDISTSRISNRSDDNKRIIDMELSENIPENLK